MDTTMVADVLWDAVGVALRVAGPILILCMLVGVVVAILQAVTSIHEQTTLFLLKLVVVVAVLMLAGGWMLENLQDFTVAIYSIIAG